MKAEQIIYEVCNYFHVPENYLQVKNRNMERIKIKHIAIYFLRRYTFLSLNEIGEMFRNGNKYLDHASIVHAIKSVNNRYETDNTYRYVIDQLDQLLKYKIEDIKYYENISINAVFLENDFYKN